MPGLFAAENAAGRPGEGCIKKLPETFFCNTLAEQEKLEYNHTIYKYLWENDPMAVLREFFQNLLYQIPKIGVSDIVDILVVSIIIYSILRLIRSTSASRVARTIVLFLIATLLTDVLKLYTVNWILNRILEVGAIALIIVFQPELRRALEHVGEQLHFHLLSTEASVSIESRAVAATVQACEIMSRERVGVLLVFERQTRLDEYFKTGTIVDAQLTEQLLRNLFFKNSPLHDGAVIVRGGRVAAAGCVMPLSDNPHLSADLGTRHRAGVGTSEASDAVVVIVSEENGTISVAIGGMLKRHLAPQTLQKLLTNELISDEEEKKPFFKRLGALFARKDGSHEK